MHIIDMRIFIFTVFVFTFFGIFPAQAGVTKDVSYGALEKQALDIYAPDGAKNAPVMVYVHGGGWTIGDKKRVNAKPQAFNREGYVFVSVGYPLLPDHGVAVQAQSVANAIAWVEENIDRYGGDAARIHIMGHSAGAHLVSLIAVNERYMRKAGSDVSVIKTVIPVDSAALDIPLRMRNLDDDPRIAKRMFRSAFGKKPGQWETFSPIHYVARGDDIPPFLILAGDRDIVSTVGRDFVGKLDARSKVITYPDKNHRDMNVEIGQDGDPIFQAIMGFVE
jgi:acetyl esterase/lipase